MNKSCVITSEIFSIQICRAIYFDHKGSCHIGHYLRYRGDAVDATRHVVRTPDGIYSRRYVLLQCDTCHQTERMYVPCSKSIRPLAGKIHLHAWRSASLISLWLNTLLPTVPPLFEEFLECLFANWVQLGRRVPYNVVSLLKSSPIQLHLKVGEEPKIARSHVGRVGSLTNQGNVVFSQKKPWIRCDEWAGALSWWSCQFFAAHRSGCLRRTALRRRQSTPS